MAPLTFVKWGGSLITDKATPYTLRTDVLSRLADELARYWPERKGPLILGHGSGSFGHEAAHASGFVGEGPPSPEALSAVQQAAARLHRHVVDALREAGIPAVSFVPSSSIMVRDGQQQSLSTDVLAAMLRQKVLPVTYGDVLLDRAKGSSIASTEAVFQILIPALAEMGHATERVLWLGDTHGVYDAEGSTISSLTAADIPEVLSAVGAPRGTDVTGGMALRLRTAAALAELDVRSVLANGHCPNLLYRLLHDDPTDDATRIGPRG